MKYQADAKQAHGAAHGAASGKYFFLKKYTFCDEFCVYILIFLRRIQEIQNLTDMSPARVHASRVRAAVVMCTIDAGLSFLTALTALSLAFQRRHAASVGVPLVLWAAALLTYRGVYGIACAMIPRQESVGVLRYRTQQIFAL